jgi:hypothetical protein
MNTDMAKGGILKIQLLAEGELRGKSLREARYPSNT